MLVRVLRTNHAKMIMFALMLVGMSCMNCARKNETNNKNMPTQSEIEAAKATTEKLLPNFEYSKIKFTETENYEHKNYQSFIIKAIDISLNNPDTSIAELNASIFDDTLILTSNFWSNRRLYHHEILVNIDGKIITVSGDVVNHDHNRLEYVLTNLNNILYFIAANPDKEVKVRLKGYSNRRFDFTLDKAQQEAICQTVELYDALMILKRAGIDPHTGEKVKPDDFPDHRL
jgi:copper chaperone CopZ